MDVDGRVVDYVEVCVLVFVVIYFGNKWKNLVRLKILNNIRICYLFDIIINE